MTFVKFQEIFHTKYPDGEVISHGKFGGTQKNMKTTVIFQPSGKCYSYYGAYEDVLNKIGFKVISKERFTEAEMRLKRLVDLNGKMGFFGEIVNNDAEIQSLAQQIKTYREEYTIA